jgi:phage FluMu protein Com
MYGRLPNDEVRCECGHLLAKLTPEGVEVKCRRCKRMHVLPVSAVGSAKSRGTDSKLRSMPD